MRKRWTTYILLLIILALVLARIHLSIVRFFDSDEMSHLHWSWLVAQGKVPYRDFFYYNLPGYQYLMSWIFLFTPSNSLLILARLWELVMFLASALLLWRISYRIVPDRIISSLGVILFLMFPMTLDKTIDTRPDIPMMLFYLLATDIILTTKTWSDRRAFTVGILVSLTVIITLKTVVFALPALAYLFFTRKPRPKPSHWLWLLGGIVTPSLLYFLYLTATDSLIAAITMVTRDGFAVNAGKSPFSPWKALSPWPLVYLWEGGDSLPWRMNTALWVLALVGLFRITLTRLRDSMFLLIFFSTGIIFLFAFPAPYVQYFIPFSVFASFLAAYGLQSVLLAVAKFSSPRRAEMISATGISIFLVFFALGFRQQYLERISAHSDNSEQLGVITSVLSMSRPDETFYDMVGSYIFRPDGYVLCCHPYAEFVDRLAEKVPTLRDSLVANKTKFVVMDRTAVVFWQPKPDDLAFLRSHYLVSAKNWKIYLHGYSFGCFRGSCKIYDIDNKPVSESTESFDIIASDTYNITVLPPHATITIDGNVFGSTSKVPMKEGQHRFSVDPEVSSWTIQLDR
jgi:hypothetical protein